MLCTLSCVLHLSNRSQLPTDWLFVLTHEKIFQLAVVIANPSSHCFLLHLHFVISTFYTTLSQQLYSGWFENPNRITTLQHKLQLLVLEPFIGIHCESIESFPKHLHYCDEINNCEFCFIFSQLHFVCGKCYTIASMNAHA